MGRAVDDQVLEGLCAFVKSINPKEGRRHKKSKEGVKIMSATEYKGQYHLIYGNAANMDILRSEEVDLVLAGPPYWPPEIEELLRDAYCRAKIN